VLIARARRDLGRGDCGCAGATHAQQVCVPYAAALIGQQIARRHGRDPGVRRWQVERRGQQVSGVNTLSLEHCVSLKEDTADASLYGSAHATALVMYCRTYRGVQKFHATCISSRSTDVLAPAAKPLGPRPQIELGCGTLVVLSNDLKKPPLR